MNNSLRIGLKENRVAFSPGDEIAGAVQWAWEKAPARAEVRLCWFTRGKGTEDVEIVDTVPLDAPALSETRTFAFRAPNEPYSFSGKLISLIWAVEVVLQPGTRFERIEIVIAPGGKEIVLPVIDQPERKARSRWSGGK